MGFGKTRRSFRVMFISLLTLLFLPTIITQLIEAANITHGKIIVYGYKKESLYL